ncbi:MAG: Helix-turn-helix domain protein [Pelotomaculum sp. PtaB.Bin104]|nr:MAG: Helix-turn-helix domain protein [Pelotomaculum sp. PtaB.Bin104]
MENDFMTIKEVVEYLKVSESTVRRLLKSGELPYYRVGKHIRIKKNDLELLRKKKND